MIFPNVDLSTIEPMKALHRAYPESTAMAMGLHPTEIADDWKDQLQRIEDELHHPDSTYIAIGEVGIDLYWDKKYAKEQTEALDAQMDMALAAGLPMIIHCRDGLDTILDLMRSRPSRIPGLIFHSFGRHGRRCGRDTAAVRSNVRHQRHCHFQKFASSRDIALDRPRPHTARDRCSVSRSGSMPRQAQRKRLSAPHRRTYSRNIRHHSRIGRCNHYRKRTTGILVNNKFILNIY